MFSRTGNTEEGKGFKTITMSLISRNLFIVGFTSSSVQFLLMREIMNISGGYELISGVFLGSWLIASASGAAIAGRSALNDIRKINLIFSLSPFISLFLMILLSGILSETGETPSFLLSIIFTFLFLVPFCLISGFTFVKLLTAARENGYFDYGRSFSIETTGGIAAGLLISLLTAGFMNTYELLLIIILLTLAYCILTWYIKNKTTKILVKLSFTVLLSIVIILNPDILFRHLLLPGIKVTETRDTPYGNITKGEYSGESSTYYNQRLLAYNDDAVEREEDIHYALLQRPDPQKVILISGSAESHIKEIGKYPVKKIIFIERDPELVKTASALADKGTAQLIVESRDAYRYIRSKGESADAVILLLPPPSTLSLNRFYTTEFFSAVKQRLFAGGVFMCSPGPGENYINKEAVNLYSSVYNSLSKVFRYVRPVVGDKLYFIASDEEISVAFCSLAAKRGIVNTYVGPDYLADDLIERKSAEVVSVLDTGIRQNRASFPIACFHFQSYNISKSINVKVPAIIILVLAFALPVLAVRRKSLIMYFSASALAGFEIIILLTMQLTAGNMYQFTGIILAAVMAGLAAGAGTEIRLLNSVPIKWKSLILMTLYVIIGLCFDLLTGIKIIPLTIVLILLLILLPSYLTGHIFRELTVSGSSKSAPSSVYSADLAGSALGFILISGLVIPAIGIKASVFFLAIMIFAGILFGTNRNK
jgi:spermidine synthase